jgi:hypothetical protein
MDKEDTDPQGRLDIALERIAAEKATRTGRVDLGNLGLQRLPEILRELERPESLLLGGVIRFGGLSRRLPGVSGRYDRHPGR